MPWLMQSTLQCDELCYNFYNMLAYAAAIPRSVLCLGLLAVSSPLAKAQQLPIQEIETGLRESIPSSKRQQFDDLQSASAYWYESRNPANLPAMDEALQKVLPLALELAPRVKKFSSWEDAQPMKPYHYAGAVLLAKAYTLLYFGRTKDAEPSVKLLEEKFPFAMILRPNRTVTWVRENLRYHQHAIAIYLAVTQQKMQGFAFPPERDEFDEPQQRQAVGDQVILRLREGDYEAVDYFVTMARKMELRTTAGRWVEDLIFEAMHPLAAEAHSDGAWTEFAQAIQSWQRVFPKSQAAKMAEAGLYLNHILVLWLKGRSYADFRSDVEVAATLIKAFPASSPGWFTLHTRVLLFSGCAMEQTMVSVRENSEHHPDHVQPLVDFCSVLAHGNQESVKTCADFVRLLCLQPELERPARVLLQLHNDGLLPRVQSRLDRSATDGLLRFMATRWQASYAMRNEMATMAVDLGARDIAAMLLAGMKDKWSHRLWAGKEDVVQEVLDTEPAQPLTLKKPTLQ